MHYYSSDVKMIIKGIFWEVLLPPLSLSTPFLQLPYLPGTTFY